MKSYVFSRLFRKQLLAYSFVTIAAGIAACSSDGYGGGGGVTPTNYTLAASLNSASEVPSNGTSGTGSLTGSYDASTYKATYTLTWTGLTGVPIGMHFHSPALAGTNASVAVAITGFTSATAGSYAGTATFTAAQGADLVAGKMYVNIHTAGYPDGEIRGQISATK
jgi:hypothetical protein